MTSRDSPPAEGERSDVTDPSVDRDDVHDDIEVFEGHPNYLFRRGVAIAGVVAAIAGGAIVVGSMIGGGDDSSSSGAAEVEWDTIVLLDERSGQIIVADESGEEQTRFASGVTSPTDALAVASILLVTSADAASVVDLSDESNQTIPLDLGSSGATIPSGSALTMLTATSAGDRAVLVHGPSGEVLDTDGSTPITGARFDVTTALAATSGRDVLITDSGNFQTVLFSFDSDEPSFFPGRALAVSDDLVVTTQNVGNEANVTVFGHDGSSVTDARSPSVRAGMIADGSVILVTVDGEIIELTVSNGTTSAVGTLDIGTVQTGHVDPTDTRLIVTGDSGTAIIDDAGVVLGTFTDGAPLLGVDEVASHTSSCVGVTADPQGSGADVGVTIASLDDGSIIAEAVAEPPLLSSVDGCTVVATTESGLSIIDGDGVTDRAADGALVAVTPDGRSVVTESAAGRLLLAVVADLPDVADEPTEQPDTAVPGTSALSEGDSDDATGSIDLGPASRLVLFTQR